MKNKKAIIAMSGGVDSSVAAFLLKQKGYEIAGITMCIGMETKCAEGKTCCSPQDMEDAKKVCQALGIPHYVLDFTEDMEEHVIKTFVNEYKNGRTPNPCVRCNEFLKFGILLDKVLAMGFDYLATGHYAGLSKDNSTYSLIIPKDREKDQTYFLYSIPNDRLRHLLFPLSDYTKPEVREIAEKEKLPVFQKPESQDICFFNEGGSTTFFKTRGIESSPGDIVHANGDVLGRHRGIIHYTIGQRRGLGISHPDPLYVISIDPVKNIITAGERQYLKSKRLIADVVHLNSPAMEGRAHAKIRYAHKPAPCEYKLKDNLIEVIFEQDQDSITPGQSLVLYKNDKVIGGGIIKRSFDQE